jgi:hypothetical protein
LFSILPNNVPKARFEKLAEQAFESCTRASSFANTYLVKDSSASEPISEENASTLAAVFATPGQKPTHLAIAKALSVMSPSATTMVAYHMVEEELRLLSQAGVFKYDYSRSFAENASLQAILVEAVEAAPTVLALLAGWLTGRNKF